MSVIRSASVLEPDDSLWRALDLLRYGGPDTVPIVDSGGRLRGIVTMRDLLPVLDLPESALLGPVSSVMRSPGTVARAGMGLEELRGTLRQGGDPSIVVVDDDGRYLGLVGLADLVAPMPIRPRPGSVGGMATPWGVYLTNGYLQAGASNVALIATGLLLGVLLALSDAGVGAAAWGVQHWMGVPVYDLWAHPQPARAGIAGAAWILMRSLAIPLFLVLLRAMPLSQYHAAEHQAVHAIERGEPLRIEVLRRMPRVHPRCGTNILAGGMVFTGVSQAAGLLGPLGLDATSASIVGALTAFFTWRSLGAALQQWFTTRPAADKHLQSGIAAAEELETRFLTTPPARRRLLRRLWCMGLLQTFIGITVGSTAFMWVADLAFHYLS